MFIIPTYNIIYNVFYINYFYTKIPLIKRRNFIDKQLKDREKY